MPSRAAPVRKSSNTRERTPRYSVSSAQATDALAATLRACNRAANAASEVAFAKDLKRRNVLQEAVYHRIKADFDPGAQAAVRTVKKVCDAYATLKSNLKAGNEPNGFLGVD